MLNESRRENTVQLYLYEILNVVKFVVTEHRVAAVRGRGRGQLEAIVY